MSTCATAFSSNRPSNDVISLIAEKDRANSLKKEGHGCNGLVAESSTKNRFRKEERKVR